MEFVYGKHGRKVLVVDKYRFYRCHLTKLGMKWRCTNNHCTAKIFVDETETRIISQNGYHNHAHAYNFKSQIETNHEYYHNLMADAFRLTMNDYVTHVSNINHIRVLFWIFLVK